MTLGEFKAWFDGFTEAIDKAPTLKQWARIKERVGEIDGKVITHDVWHHRYWGPYYSPPYTYPYIATSCGSATVFNTDNITSNTAQLAFNSSEAMYAAGAAEAQGITFA